MNLSSFTEQIASTGGAEPILDINFGVSGDTTGDVNDIMGDLGLELDGLFGLPVSPTMSHPEGSPGAPQSPSGSTAQDNAAEANRTSAEVSPRLGKMQNFPGIWSTNCVK